MISYKSNDPKGWHGNPIYGAALGRGTVGADLLEFEGKLYLRRSYLDNGGYDVNGTYFGQGAPLYWVSSEDGEIDRMLRARDREKAKDQVKEWYPKARFFK